MRVLHLPSQRNVPAVWHHCKLHVYIALTQAGKLRAGLLPAPPETCHMPRPHHTGTGHQDRETSLCDFSLAGRDMESLESKGKTPILGPNTLFPAINCECSSGTSCHQDILVS